MDGWRFVLDRVSVRYLPIQSSPGDADSAAIAGAFAASQKAYAAAAKELLLPEQLPEGILNNFGYRMLGRGKTWWALRSSGKMSTGTRDR